MTRIRITINTSDGDGPSSMSSTQSKVFISKTFISPDQIFSKYEQLLNDIFAYYGEEGDLPSFEMGDADPDKSDDSEKPENDKEN